MSKAKKNIVHVCLYTHKHGTDVWVCKTPRGLEAEVLAVMKERVREDWHDEDKVRFSKLRGFDKKLNLFHEVEQGISYGETLELFEREVL